MDTKQQILKAIEELPEIYQSALRLYYWMGSSVEEIAELIGVPENTNATFSVSYFDGDFDSCFPVTLKDQQSKRRFRFQLGSGSAQVELESFSGHIKMCRPGQMEDHDDEKE